MIQGSTTAAPSGSATVDGGFEPSEDPRPAMRRRAMIWYALTALLFTVLTAVGISVTAVLVSLPSLLLALATVVRGWDHPPPRPLTALALLVGGVTLVAAMATDAVAFPIGPGLVVGVWAAHREGRRLASSMLGGGALLALAAIGQWLGEGPGRPSLGTAALLIAVMILVVLETDIQRRALELVVRAKDAERRASILQERNRFAADLHDIQGHTLHVIKLKAAVASRLLDTDPERSRQELAAIQALVGQTIGQARELANSTHRLSLHAELTNAVGLFEAAGIDTNVEGGRTGAVPAAQERLLAHVLREATTNALRHARPRRVDIVLTAEGLEVCNDGLGDDAGTTPPLRGLATLRARVREAGGELSARRDGDRFVVTARFEDASR